MTRKVLSVFMSFIMLCSIFISGNLCTAASGRPDQKENFRETVYRLRTYEASEYGYADTEWVNEDGEVLQDETAGSSGLNSARSAMPSAYDARDYGYVSSVKNQGMAGSCWAFSAAAVAEANLLKNGLRAEDDDADLNNLSEAHLVWFAHRSYTENPEDATKGDGRSVSSPYLTGGNWESSTYTLARGCGLALEKDYKFYPYSLSVMGNYPESERYRSSVYLKNSYKLSDANAVKKAVLENGAAMCAYFSDDTYYNSTTGAYYFFTELEENQRVATNHQVAIVGWDDDYDVSNFNASCRPSGNGAWLIKNSWGTSWGNGGYGWISYEDISLDGFYTQQMDEAENYSNIYQYDGFGYTYAIHYSTDGDPGKNASVANVFTSQKDELLNAVSFYTCQSNVSYTVNVYTGVTRSGASPVENGVLRAVQSGTAAYAGYHTVDLEQPVDLKEGENFAVVVEISQDSGILIPFEGSTQYIEAESGEQTLYCSYSSEPGQSYYRLKNSAWQESSGTNKNNVCVKAFTIESSSMEIQTAAEWKTFAESVNNGEDYRNKNIYLTADIDFGGITDLPAAGTQANPFRGRFYGNHHIISNLSVQGSGNYQGLFGYLDTGASIQDIGIESGSVTGDDYTGSLAGYLNGGSVSGCYSVIPVAGGRYTGGLIGYNNAGSISKSFSAGEVNSAQERGVFAGFDNSGTYSRCYYLSQTDIQGIPNLSSAQVAGADAHDMSSGRISYELDDGSKVARTYHWTKGDAYPAFASSPDQAVYKLELYEPSADVSDFIYVMPSENPASVAENLRSGYRCRLYTNYACTAPLQTQITYDRILYAVWTMDKLELKADASLEVYKEKFLIGLEEYRNKVKQVKAQFANENIRFYDINGHEMSDESYVGTGTSVVLLDGGGNQIDRYEFILFGDGNADGWIDAFDMTLIVSYMCFEIDDEDVGESVIMAMDVSHDEWCDEVDMIYMDLASVYAYSITQSGF